MSAGTGPEGGEGAAGQQAPPAAQLVAAVAALSAQVAALEKRLAVQAELRAKDQARFEAGQRKVEALLAAVAAGVAPEDYRDWSSLPGDVLKIIAGQVVAQSEAAQAAWLKEDKFWMNEEQIQQMMAQQKRDGNCLFVFAMVCKEWRKAQLKVGGPLRTRVRFDVIAPGSVALMKWALAEGFPRDDGCGWTVAYGAAEYMVCAAAQYGRRELVKWLCGEGGFAMDENVMENAARSGNLALVQWLRAEGCPWNQNTCFWAVSKGHVELLRWARECGCPWRAEVRDRAAAKLGYTDNFDW